MHFDFVHRRSSISIFKLCLGCKKKLSMLDELIKVKIKDVIYLVRMLSLYCEKNGWTILPKGILLCMILKFYKYDVDRNSGFYKNWREKFRVSVMDKLAEWTLGYLVSGIIGGLIAAIFVTILE